MGRGPEGLRADVGDARADGPPRPSAVGASALVSCHSDAQQRRRLETSLETLDLTSGHLQCVLIARLSRPRVLA